MAQTDLFEIPTKPLQFEEQLRASGFDLIAGVDEAGRGALAGPVVAAAVIFSKDVGDLISKVRDSKKLSAEAREKLFPEIHRYALSVGVGIMERDKIDEINILQATLQAMKIAVSNLRPQPHLCLIDGNAKPPIDLPQKLIIKGDDRVFCIGAASIIAKVTRDRLMISLDQNFPQYGFKIHKGYGTELHRKAIGEFGPSPHHRISFSLPEKSTP